MNGKHKEGELFKRVNAFGKIFDIYYGYYEEDDRHSIWGDPVPVYPDLAKNPEYDEGGNRIVTRMQVACENYSGRQNEDSCSHCPYFRQGKDLFGICLCELNRKNE